MDSIRKRLTHQQYEHWCRLSKYSPWMWSHWNQQWRQQQDRADIYPCRNHPLSEEAAQLSSAPLWTNVTPCQEEGPTAGLELGPRRQQARIRNAPSTRCTCAVMPRRDRVQRFLVHHFLYGFLAQRPQWRLQHKCMDSVGGTTAKPGLLAVLGHEDCKWGIHHLEMGTGTDLHIVCPLDHKAAQIFMNMDYGNYRRRNHTSIFVPGSEIKKGLIRMAVCAVGGQASLSWGILLWLKGHVIMLHWLQSDSEQDCEFHFHFPKSCLG